MGFIKRDSNGDFHFQSGVSAEVRARMEAVQTHNGIFFHVPRGTEGKDLLSQLEWAMRVHENGDLVFPLGIFVAHLKCGERFNGEALRGGDAIEVLKWAGQNKLAVMVVWGSYCTELGGGKPFFHPGKEYVELSDEDRTLLISGEPRGRFFKRLENLRRIKKNLRDRN